MQCGTFAACEQSAHAANVTSHVLQPRNGSYHFLTGFFYPGNPSNPQWAFRFQFSDLPMKATIEEDVDKLGGGFACPHTADESEVSTSTGRTVCYISFGSDSEARYYEDGVLYKVYLLPPMPHIQQSAVQSLLSAFIDRLQ